MQAPDNFLWTLSTFILPFLFSIILHEIAHGYVALKLGDDTALKMRRLTLNPIAHIDVVGSVILPVSLFVMGTPFLFGWAKPVPVSFNRLNNPKKDMGLVALAGPAMNFFLAALFVIGLSLGKRFLPLNLLSLWLMQNLFSGFVICVALCAINLFPLLPLDGGRIVASILPSKWSACFSKSEPYGMLILVGILFILPMLSNILKIDLNIFSIYVQWIKDGLIRMLSVFMI